MSKGGSLAPATTAPSVGERLRLFVLSRDNWRCTKCGKSSRGSKLTTRSR